MVRLSASLPLLAVLATAPVLASAYSWKFNSTPKQCGNLELEITGSGGKGPYRALILPTGVNPTQKDFRRVVEIPFNDTSKLSFPLRLPAQGSFVIAVSDASGFGTGGVSAVIPVADSDDSSCLRESSLSFYIAFEPQNLNTCKSVRIYWDTTKTKGTVNWFGVIPGGQPFTMSGPITDLSNQGFGVGFNWTVPLADGTQAIIAASDDRGFVAGSVTTTVTGGAFPDDKCLSNAHPTSTPGDPAGGSYQTTTAANNPTQSGSPQNGGGGNSSNDGGKKTNIGAIVGGVVGGVVGLIALLLLLLFFRRRSRFHQQTKERPVDLLNDDNDAHDGSELPQYYRPDPFVLPNPSAAGDHSSMREGENAGLLGAVSAGRPSHDSISNLSVSTRGPGMVGAAAGGIAGASSASRSRPSTERSSTGYGNTSSAAGRKGAGGPPPLRPVNIIQHDDGGRVPEADKAEAGEDETIELPPAYTNIKRGPSTRVPADADESASATGSSAPQMQMPVPSLPAGSGPPASRVGEAAA